MIVERKENYHKSKKLNERKMNQDFFKEFSYEMKASGFDLSLVF